MKRLSLVSGRTTMQVPCNVEQVLHRSISQQVNRPGPCRLVDTKRAAARTSRCAQTTEVTRLKACEASITPTLGRSCYEYEYRQYSNRDSACPNWESFMPTGSYYSGIREPEQSCVLIHLQSRKAVCDFHPRQAEKPEASSTEKSSST